MRAEGYLLHTKILSPENMSIQKLKGRAARVFLSETQALLMAARWHLWFGVNKKNRCTGIFLEFIIPNALALLVTLPFLPIRLSEKPRFREHKNYFVPALMTVSAMVSIYECFYYISDSLSIAMDGLSYPMSMAILSYIISRIRGSQIRLPFLCFVILMNIAVSLKTAIFTDILVHCINTVRLLMCVVLSTSSDFITGCATNDMGFFRFLQGYSLYALLFGMMHLLNTCPLSGFSSTIIENPLLCSSYAAAQIISNISSCYYIKRLGLLSYSTTKISTFIYYSLYSTYTNPQKSDELPVYLGLLAFYLFTTIFFRYSEVFDTYLNFVI
jgi:hypothetical protein